jgi:Domain of unknown function (DUF4272)
MKIIIIVSFCSLLFSCGNSNEKIDNNVIAEVKIDLSEEEKNATPDQKERKKRSDDFLQAEGIPFYKGAFYVDSEANAKIRTKDEIVDRALALCYLGVKSEGLDKKSLQDFDKKYNIMSKLTEEEKKYVLSENPTEQQKTDANWRYESLHVLLWSLGYIDKLKSPIEVCNVADDVKIIFSKTEKEFRNGANVRSVKEILDANDLALRYNWACVNARVNNEKTPKNIDSSICLERHYATNWLTNFLNQEWDNVSTDT